jgi:hypothetical protein
MPPRAACSNPPIKACDRDLSSNRTKTDVESSEAFSSTVPSCTIMAAESSYSPPFNLGQAIGETPAHPSITVGRWKVNTDVRREEDNGFGRSPRT